MLRLRLAILIASAAFAHGQQEQANQPKVKVNVINVCTPAQQEKQEIASALARVPKEPLFRADFEVDRGRTTLEQSPNFLEPGSGLKKSGGTETADWVRIRREFSLQALFSTVQYSFSVDAKNMVETLVFRVRDPKDLMQVSIEDSASAVTTASAMLGTSTPASRIKLERFGKSSVVLARCSATEAGPPPDQSAYEPLFQSASAVVTKYRSLLGAKAIVPEELTRLRSAPTAKPKTEPTAKRREHEWK
ncbi:MAG: hypothetical protein DMG89_13490 [Acidobacteria bacterium]|nr:MAG: hypothetical protein DMG89_13490 [Acidobacteriota bacterium]